MRMTALVLALIGACIVAVGCGNPATPTPPVAKTPPKTPAPAEKAPATPTVPNAVPAAPISTAAPQDDKALFETSCSKCHGVEKVAAFSEAVPWKEIVDRMITVRGAKISAEDAAKIVAYLNKTYPKK